MSDDEGFELLDETFGVREASDASDTDSPHPRNSAAAARKPSSLLQQPPQPTSSTPAGSLNDHAHHTHLGGVGAETGGESSQEQAANTPDSGMTAISPQPQQEAKGCQRGTVPEKGAVLKIPGAGAADWGRFRLTAPGTGEHRERSSTLAKLSPPKDPRPRPVKEKNKSSSGGRGSIQSKRIKKSPIPAALPPPPTEGGNGSTRTNGEEDTGSSELFKFLLARAGEKGFVCAPAPAPAATAAAPSAGAFPDMSTAASSNNHDISPVGNLHHTQPAVALDVPFNPRAAAPLPPTQQQQEQPHVARSVAADPFQLASLFGPLPSPMAPGTGFGDENRKPGARGSASSTAATASLSALAEDEAATMELVGMGFDREHVVRALTECGRGESWKEAAISLLLEPQMTTMPSHSETPVGADGDPESRLSGGERQAVQRWSAGPAASPSSCPICLGDIQAGGVFTVDCKDQHTFCVDCLHQHCGVQLLDSGLIPACPLSNMTCGHELSQDEVERVFLLKRYSTAGEGGTDGGTAAASEQGSDRRALDTCRTLLTRRGLESTGAVPCVSPECGNWMVPEGGGQRVRCDSCLIEFCRRCKRAPYHYTAKCEEVVAFGREWSSWLTEGKAAFLKAMAAQDSDHKALLDQHNNRKKEHDRAVQEAERLRLEYDRMEDWKESRCRCCPHCGRTIEKLSGCDHMVCGLDAHGGNAQNGCGRRFMWNQARPYKGDRGERKATPFTEQEPAAAARSRHFIAEGIPLRCDRCHRDVVGPLFRCVHCPSFACCLECQDMACRDPRHVHHTFQVVDGKRQDIPLSASAAPGGGRGSGGGSSGGGMRDMDVDDPA